METFDRSYIYTRHFFVKKARNVKGSARRRGKACELRPSDIRALIEAYPVCPCCCRHYDLYDARLTIDRIDPSLGYTRGNVQVLCLRCNHQKGNAVRRFFQKHEWHSAAQGLWYPELIMDLMGVADRSYGYRR